MSNEKKLLIVPPKSLSAADKKKLEKSNYIVIETDNPDNIKIIDRLSFPQDMEADLVLDAALRAIRSGGSNQTKINFAELLSNRLAPVSKPKTTQP